MKIENKCTCENSTGSTHIECCNICGLPLQKEQWHFYLPDEKSKRVQPLVMQKTYGVVEWVNNQPILNGMRAFKDKESALKYCATRLNGQVNKDIYAEQTIIEINFSDVADIKIKAKLMENKYWLNFLTLDTTNIIHKSCLKDRITELENIQNENRKSV